MFRQESAAEVLYAKVKAARHSCEGQQCVRILLEVGAHGSHFDRSLCVMVEYAVGKDMLEHLVGHAADEVFAVFVWC